MFGLQVQYNMISTLLISGTALENVGSIDLGWNKIHNWAEVLKLGVLKK